MNLFTKILKVVSMIPALVLGVEQMSGAKNGQDKATAVLGFAQLIVEDIPGNEVKDKDAFNDGLRMVNDGVVKCLNASLWHK